MTFSQALFTHVSEVAAEAQTYALTAPADAASTGPVVVISFDGAVFTGLSEPDTCEENYTITVVSDDHLEAVTLARALALNFNAFSGVMGGDGGVEVVDIEASEGPEEYDADHSLFARNVSLRVTYEF